MNQENSKRKYISYLILLNFLHLTIADIIVRSPLSLKDKFDKGIIKTSYATFGFNPYGYTLTGRVFYDPTNKEKDLACDYEKIKDIVTEKTNKIDHAPIIMVDRGNCHFVDKARNIQKAGGKVALVINNDDNDPKNIIMIDDGTGSDIMIPLILISKKDGEILKDYYIRNQMNTDSLKKLILDIDFQIEHNSNTALVEIFMNSESSEIYNLIEQFTKYSDLCKDLI